MQTYPYITWFYKQAAPYRAKAFSFITNKKAVGYYLPTAFYYLTQGFILSLCSSVSSSASVVHTYQTPLRLRALAVINYNLSISIFLNHTSLPWFCKAICPSLKVPKSGH